MVKKFDAFVWKPKRAGRVRVMFLAVAQISEQFAEQLSQDMAQRPAFTVRLKVHVNLQYCLWWERGLLNYLSCHHNSDI